jgi:hypothetical protein
MALDELNTFLGLPAMIWFFVAIAVAVGFVILIAVHETFIMTKFAKKARGLKRAKGLPALIQDNNVIRLYTSDGSLPEGLFHIAKSWFVRPRRPFLPKNTGRVGHPTKEEMEAKKNGVNMDILQPGEREALEEILECPILEDTGKAVFIGCVGQPLLTNIATVAHANITDIQEVLPIVYPPTIIDALQEYSEKKGYLRGGKDQMKLIYLAIAAAMVIAPLGLIVYLLTQPRVQGAALMLLVGVLH